MEWIHEEIFKCPLDQYALKIDLKRNKVYCLNKKCKSKFKLLTCKTKKIPCLIDTENFDTVFKKDFLKPKRIFENNNSNLYKITQKFKDKIDKFFDKKYSPPYKKIVINQINNFINKNEKKCLIIGSGNRNLPNSIYNSQLNIIGCDLYPGEQVDFIADAHYLPLKDNCINIIFIQAVLEHVLEPQKVIDECFRVLAKNGMIISEAPFLQGIHENQYDFFRFSPSAHVFLFRKFKILDFGPLQGSLLSFVWILRGITSRFFKMKIAKFIFFPFFIFIRKKANRNIKADWDYCNSSYVVAIKKNFKSRKNYHKGIIKLYEHKKD